ncbi:MAG: hypothetical protein U9Q03_05935 [Patescibacteria group bacterium]|nr:hypothetical protein [Patescibacteria group bacterium]
MRFSERYRPPSFHSGTEHERSLFGEADVRGDEYDAEMKRLGADEQSHLKFGPALELVKKFQPSDDAENPSRPFFNDLRIEIVDVLEEFGVEADVRAYTAVGTPLDKYHGTDAFVEIEVGGQEVIVTFDATLNPDKLQGGHKADLMVGDMPDPLDDSEEEDKYLDEIRTLAIQAANKALNRFDEQVRRAS